MESAVNTSPTSEETVAKLQPLASGANPVALEIAVNVTGARPASSSGQRDLFSEDTSTVLVYENGTVIRLAAAVVTGQLLFLTDKRTNSEVVCQVIRKRNFRPTECYVELEFTEPVPKFWGVEFPAEAASPAQADITKMVESSETAEADAAPEAPLAPGPEVENLKQEVDSLREQIQALLQAKAEAAKVEAAREEAAKKAEGAAAEVTRISAAKPATPATPPIEPTKPPAPASVPAEDKLPEAGAGATAGAVASAAATPMIRMTLPKVSLAKEGGAKDAAEIDPLDCLLPKPALDFSAAPRQGTAKVPQSLYDIYKPVRAGIGKFPLAVISTLVLAIFLAGAWRLNWLRLPWLGSYSAQSGISRNARPANLGKPQSAVARPVTPGAASPGAPKTDAALSSPNAATSSAVAEATPSLVAGRTDTPSAPGSVQSVPEEAASPKAGRLAAPAALARRAKSKENGVSSLARGKNATGAKQPAAAEAAQPEPPPSDAALLPPRLLKSVPPVYPPEAMENYITGDVRVDAVVEPDGKIGAMKILAGPAPLRQAAMDALKQYEYAPATQGGKAVAAHVTATVKFWFNP